MEYYFKIAGVKIKVDTDTEFDWNPHIRTFASEAFRQADEVYKIRMADELHKPDGRIVYQGATCSRLKRPGTTYLSAS